jgi:hypothetical protein
MLPGGYLPWYVSKNRMPTLALKEKRIKIWSKSLQMCGLYPIMGFFSIRALVYCSPYLANDKMF